MLVVDKRARWFCGCLEDEIWPEYKCPTCGERPLLASHMGHTSSGRCACGSQYFWDHETMKLQITVYLRRKP